MKPAKAVDSSSEPVTVAPTVDQARELAAEVLEANGAPKQVAQRVAESLVQAERMGHASHGLLRVREYADRIAEGQIRPGELPAVISRKGSVGVVDGRWGWGHLAAELAARTAVEIASETGVGFVTVRHCNHSGRLGEWVERIAADRRFIGVGFLSCGPAVAPLGGRDRVLGTNPLAIAVPTTDRPVVLDFATAGIAEGKVRVAARAGRQVPPGVLQTADGVPTTDPDDFYSGGTILPFGLHKGYGLSVAIQLMGEALTGGGRPGALRDEMANGLALLALSIDRAGGPQEFLDLADACRARITSSRPVDAGHPVVLPGDVEAAQVAAQPPGRVVVAGSLWDELHEALERGQHHG